MAPSTSRDQPEDEEIEQALLNWCVTEKTEEAELSKDVSLNCPRCKAPLTPVEGSIWVYGWCGLCRKHFPLTIGSLVDVEEAEA